MAALSLSWWYALLCSCYLLVATLPSGIAEVKTIELDWKVPSSGFPDETVKVGDIVTFKWTGNHNVFRHDTESCDLTEGTVLGSRNPQSYTFVESDVGERSVYFACHVGTHCSSGQHITFTVTSSSNSGDDAELLPSSEDPTNTAGGGAGRGRTLSVGIVVLVTVATWY